jgi:hypothetical protein
MSLPLGVSALGPTRRPALALGPGNMFQKRRVSSPAPVTTLWPSGDIARYRTLWECRYKPVLHK